MPIYSNKNNSSARSRNCPLPLHLQSPMPAKTRRQIGHAQQMFPFFKNPEKPTDEEQYSVLLAKLEFRWCSHLESQRSYEEICPDFADCRLCNMILLCRQSSDIYEPWLITYNEQKHNLEDAEHGFKHKTVWQKDMEYPHWTCFTCDFLRKLIHYNIVGSAVASECTCDCKYCYPSSQV